MADEAKKEINLDEKVTVKNLAGWEVSFSRKAEGIGDVLINPNGSYRLSRNEIIAQVQSGNRLFSGTDGLGSHATIFIDDAPTRKEVGFESEDGKTKQKIFSDKLVQKLFGYATQANFENAVQTFIITRAEKYAIIEAVKRLKLNDYSKIRFIEKYTGYKLD